MKPIVLFLFLITLQLHDEPITGNPSYDFPENLTHSNRYGNDNVGALSNAGFYYESLKQETDPSDPLPTQLLTLRNKTIVNAKEFILQKAKEYRILLINESHNRPQHRLFTKSLLRGLYKEGYHVLLAEGISRKNGLENNNYPISSDGFYLSEPNYAAMLRYARKIGFEIYAYDYGKTRWTDSIVLDQYGSTKYLSYEPRDSAIIKFDKNGQTDYIMTSVRENLQAQNIYKVIQQHPKAKFVIHAGNGHLAESGPMMGAKLRALLNQEDLLTIDQVQLNDRIVVMDTVTGSAITRPFSYLLKDNYSGKFFHYFHGEQVDYTIFNAVLKDSLSRPGFLYTDVEKRTPQYLPQGKIDDCPCMFTAYYPGELKKEGSAAVAVDVLYVPSPSTQKPFLLYKGNYTVVKKNSAGQYSHFSFTH
jgi:hypothetical protein